MEVFVTISLIVLYLVVGVTLVRTIFPVDHWWEFVLVAGLWPLLFVIALVNWVFDW